MVSVTGHWCGGGTECLSPLTIEKDTHLDQVKSMKRKSVTGTRLWVDNQKSFLLLNDFKGRKLFYRPGRPVE